MAWKRATSSWVEAGVRAGWVWGVTGLRGFKRIAGILSGIDGGPPGDGPCGSWVEDGDGTDLSTATLLGLEAGVWFLVEHPGEGGIGDVVALSEISDGVLTGCELLQHFFVALVGDKGRACACAATTELEGGGGFLGGGSCGHGGIRGWSWGKGIARSVDLHWGDGRALACSLHYQYGTLRLSIASTIGHFPDCLPI